MADAIGELKDVVTGKTVIKNSLSATKLSKYKLDEYFNCEDMNPGDMY